MIIRSVQRLGENLQMPLAYGCNLRNAGFMEEW